MKTFKLIIPFLLFVVVAGAQQKPAAKTDKAAATIAPIKLTGTPTDEFYEHFVLKHSDDPAPEGYGFSPQLPITVGAYETNLTDQKNIALQVNRFLKSYLWADGSRITFIDRKSVMINSVNYDKMRITKTGTKDTLTLYTDMYKSGPISLPKGMIFYSKEKLFEELSPLAVQVVKYDAVPDKYADASAKQASFQLIGLLQNDIGLDYLMDQDYLAPLINDVGQDTDLKAFLIRSYVVHKFLYELTGQPNPKTKAYNIMVDDYQTVIKTHEILSKGHLADLMVKKQ
jgi:hypothetical protein